MSRKYNLKVISIEKSTPSSVVISLEGMDEHSYNSGQYLTLELDVKGEQVNRSYSFCSSPSEDHWKIGVKHVPNGKASTFLNQDLRVGDSITCLEPMGNFVLPTEDASSLHYTFFAAGSGITPIYSMIKHLLNSTNAGKVSLFYGNKTPEETMFLNELKSLDNEHANFNLDLIYSQSGGEDSLHSGRINFGKTLELLRLYPSGNLAQHAFICGPGDMISSVKNALLDNNFNEDHLHIEFFSAPTEETPASVESPTEDSGPFSGTAKVTITLDDEEHSVTAADGGPVLLDVALNAGLDAPFSCKGGVCTACRAKLTKGKVHMDSNFALTDDELEEGFILTCQSHPKSDVIELSYDE